MPRNTPKVVNGFVLHTEGRPNFRPPKSGKLAKPYQREQKTLTDRAAWYPDDWEEISFKMRQEAGWRCQSHRLFGGAPCGVYAPPPLQSVLHVHHIIPLPKGTSKKSNLIVLCTDCHKRAHNDKKGMGPTAKQAALLKRLGKK